nr:hypothetical protein GCM10025732_39320 [Glycomyces mayteni]
MFQAQVEVAVGGLEVGGDELGEAGLVGAVVAARGVGGGEGLGELGGGVGEDVVLQEQVGEARDQGHGVLQWVLV